MDNSEEKDSILISKNEINKTIMHLNWSNRRMFLALIAVCITFIIVVTINTIRETRWQNTVKELQSQMTTAITEIQNGKTGN